MGRKQRHDDDGVFHHVFNRGARRDLIFFDDLDRRIWLEIFVDVSEKRGLELHAWCLMGNHFHLLVRSTGRLADMMRDACSMYVKVFNRRHDLDGPLHTSSYRNEPISSDEYFATASRYIHRNPVDIFNGPVESYQWSSYRFFLTPESAPAWLQTSFTLAMFGGSVERYRDFVSGDLQPRTTSSSTPPIDLAFGPVVSLGQIVSAIGALTDTDPADLARGRAGVRSPARMGICMLASEFEISADATAAALGYGSLSAVRSGLHRGRALVQTDPAFVALLATARRLLTRAQLDAAA